MQQRLRRFSALFLTVGLLLVLTGVAAANAGPSRISGDKAGPLLPGTTSQMHVRRELLRFDVADDLRTATVTAQYDLENTGGPLTNFPVVFVVRNGDQPKVTWNGQPLAVGTPDQGGLLPEQVKEMETAWGAMQTGIDPVTGKAYDTAGYFQQTSAGFFTFAFDVPAGGKGTLAVSYLHQAAYDKLRYAHEMYNYQYLLLPARGWASFGPLEIRIKAPDPSAAYFAANLPFERQGAEYVANLSGLPDQNLAFGLMSRADLIGNWATRGPYYWVVFLLVLVGATGAGLGIARLAGRIRSRTWAVITGIIGGLLGGGAVDLVLTITLISLFHALDNDSYGRLFIGAGQWVVAVLLSTVLAGIYSAKWHRPRA